MPEKRRLGFIDLAKAFAFALVVCGHTFMPGSRIRAIIYSFHMPLFFLLAGYTFSAKPMRRVVESSAKRLLLPYFLAYTTATAIPSVLIWTQEGRLSKLVELAKSLFFAAGNGNEIGNVGAFWFLAALFLARIVFNALLNEFEKRSLSLPVQGAICSAVGVLGYLVGTVLRLWLPLAFDISLVATFFMWCGYAMRKTGVMEKEIHPALIVLLLAVWAAEIATGLPGWNQALSMLGREYNLFPLAPLGAVSGSFLLVKLCAALESAFSAYSDDSVPRKVLLFGEYIGRNCMKLYLIHCFDFNFNWPGINLALFGSTALFSSIARIAFDILVLLLFENA